MDEHSLFDMVHSFTPTNYTSTSFTATPTTTTYTPTTTTNTIITTTPTIEEINTQTMKSTNDWSLDAIVNSTHTHTTTAFNPTITNTPSIQANTIRMMNNPSYSGLDHVVNGHSPSNDVWLSSSIISTSTIPIPIPIPATSIPTNTNLPTLNPTISDYPGMLQQNDQTIDHNLFWDPYAVTGMFSPNIRPSSSSSIVPNNMFIPTETFTLTAHTLNNPNWDGSYNFDQHTMIDGFSSFNIDSASSFLETTTPTMSTSTNIHFQGKSSFQGESLNLYPTNNPQKFSKKPQQTLFSKNWPVLTLPILGKITESRILKQQQNQPQRRKETLDLSKSTKINDRSSSMSNERKNEKRIYKMPRQALNNDVWSWRKYAEKVVDGSPYPRIYYNCNSTKECMAKKCVQQDNSNPDYIITEYTGQHDHPMPMFMNSSTIDATANHPKFGFLQQVPCIVKSSGNEDR